MRSLLVLLLAVGCGDDKDGTPNRPSDPTTDTSTTTSTLPSSFDLTGTVIDQDGEPVPEAMVLFGGRPDTMVLTDAAGAFTIHFAPLGYGEPAIVAAKAGYRAIGDEFFDADSVIELTLREVSDVDNLDYVYQDPGDGQDLMLEDCTHCHTAFVAEFLESGHAEAARNPLLHDLYAGVSTGHDQASCETAGGSWATGREPGTESDTVDKCYLGGGVLPDLNPQCGGPAQLPCDAIGADAPTAFGACADCHAPGINGVAGGRDLHDAHGLAFDLGIHCDTCHKVRDIDMSLPPGVGQRLVMGRPSEPGQNMFEWDPVYYGPLIDVPNIAMGGSYQPKFAESVFCAGCHEQEQPALVPGDQLAARWTDGLPVHSTYSEWEASPHADAGTQCQDCHMPAHLDLNNAVDLSTPEESSIRFGFPRDPEDIRQHIFRGPLEGSPRMIDSALLVSLTLSTDGDELVVDAGINNGGCGHAVPTGEPMRALVLVLEAEGDCGVLVPSAGMTVPDTGGALASGIIDTDLTVVGDQVHWPAHPASPGMVLRVVRPTGGFDDYIATGAFATMNATDKGMEIFDPVAEVTVQAVAGDTITASAPLAVSPGDLVFIGQAWSAVPVDGQPAIQLAGHAGYAFAKVLTDATGARHVPHYKAVDIASDNRIAPAEMAQTSHRFDLPVGCAAVEARATLLYRPVPLSLADDRGWEALDYVVGSTSVAL